MKEVRQLTTEEIVLAAATDVAILMQPLLSQDDEEMFLKIFMQKAFEMLEKKENLFVGFGPDVARSNAFFTEDMQAIMQFVEENTNKNYSFRNGRLLMYFSKEQGTGIWEDD